MREPHSELQSVVQALSTGPVAVGDQVGYSNRSLIMRACDMAGQLLTPDFPARELDAHFAHFAFANDRSGGGCQQMVASTCTLQHNVDFQGNDLGPAHRNVSSPSA